MATDNTAETIRTVALAEEMEALIRELDFITRKPMTGLALANALEKPIRTTGRAILARIDGEA